MKPWYSKSMKPTELMQNLGLRANRALGQNFMTDAAALEEIAAAAGIAGMTVLEIGPGLGALTRPLLARASRVTAVEKDAALADYLRGAIPDARLTVVTADFLRCDEAPAAPWAAVGNLPYYATTPIVEKLLCMRPDRMTLMVQREAAARFFAQPRERVYGPLAALTAVSYLPQRIMELPRTVYDPAPDVDSTVVLLTRKSDAPDDAEAFLRFLKRAFAMRRKTLVNNLGDAARDALPSLGLPSDVRAEAAAPETLYRLYRLLI